MGLLNRAAGLFIKRLQDVQGVSGQPLRSFNFEVALAARDFDIQLCFNAPQVLLQGATEMRQPGVVQRRESVFQNQVDNPWLQNKGACMIGRLTGVVAEKAPPQILMDCHGVGYEVWVPMSTFYHLPAVGERTTLLTHFVVREDAQILFGFLSAGERDAFRQLIKISGVGPRTALGILSGLSVSDLAQAIQSQEADFLVKIPGIGKKTAERLLLELKGKLDWLGESTGLEKKGQQGEKADVLQALVALGYSEKEAQLALKSLPLELSVSEGIKWALKSLST